MNDNNRQKWTLKSIAAELGVSNATVSNAFNRPDQLSKGRRESILAACRELGYYGPNKAARSLRRGTSNIVALVLPDSVEYMVSDSVASSFVRGVASKLEKAGINLLLFSGSADDVSSVVDFVDGFICYGCPRNPRLFDHLKDQLKPVVTVDFDIDGLASVNIDNRQAAYDIALQALRSSDDRVAVLGLRLLDSKQPSQVYEPAAPDDGTSIAHLRLAGYQQALIEKGIELGKANVWSVPENTSGYAQVMAEQVLSAKPVPNVLLCMSDLIALAAMRQAQSLGLSIPEDVRIVGFDGIEESAHSNPTLATVAQNSVAKGVAAAELFLARSDEKQQLDYQLISGNSI